MLVAKPALPLLGRPLIQWTLELLAEHGVTDVVVNLHHLPRTVVRAVGDPARLGIRVTYSRERTILGTSGGPRKVRDYFGDEPFLLVNGDMAFDFDLTSLVERHRRSGARATLALKPNPDPRAYGPVMTGRRGWIASLAGMPRPVPGRPLLFTGVHVLDPALLDRLPRGPSDSVRDLYAPLVAEGGGLLGVRVRGPWYDLGSPRRYLASSLSMLVSGFRGRPAGSFVHPEARVHAGARVFRSVIGSGSVVEEGAEVRESVLWDNVSVGPGATLRRCVVTSHARIRPGQTAAERLVIAGKRTLDRSGGRLVVQEIRG
jgi:mannose-1-phosphate guanylyltransferase